MCSLEAAATTRGSSSRGPARFRGMKWNLAGCRRLVRGQQQPHSSRFSSAAPQPPACGASRSPVLSTLLLSASSLDDELLAWAGEVDDLAGGGGWGVK